MREDLGNDRKIYDACPEPVEGACPEPAEGAAMIVKGLPHFGQAVMSISNTRFSSWASSGGSVLSEWVHRWDRLWGRPLRGQSAGAGLSWTKYAMEANEVKPGTWDQRSQALEEFEGGHDDMGGAIAVRGFEFEHDVTFWCARQAFMAQGGPRDVSAEAFEGGALMRA